VITPFLSCLLWNTRLVPITFSFGLSTKDQNSNIQLINNILLQVLPCFL
jgi:hypothetical protein